MEKIVYSPLLVLTVEEFEEFQKIVSDHHILNIDKTGASHNIIEVFLKPTITVNQIWLYSRMITKRLYFKNIHDVTD
jgi:hypothetical protein